MRWILVALVMCAAVPAFADDFPDDAPKKRVKCKSPPCVCQDTTRSDECLSKDACVSFCSQHDGPVKGHKRQHRRRGGTAPAEDKSLIDL